MAIDPITLGILLKGAGNIAGGASRIFKPKFGSTQYGRELKNISRHGMLTPGQETGIIGNVSRTANRQSALSNSRYMGGLINRGMQGSVSGRRGLREAEADVRRTVADTSRGMFQQEESAKRQAKLDYARAVDRDKEERRQAGWQTAGATASLLGDLSGAKGQRQADTRQSYMDMATKYGADNIQAINAPGDEAERYTRYGAKAGAMPTERIQAIEEYAQKSNIKDASGVTGAFSALQSGDIDAKSFRKQLKTGNNPLTDEQIDNLFAFLANL